MENPLSHEDYCRIIGGIYVDSYQRILSLERQLAPLHESFQEQMDKLRKKIKEQSEIIDHLSSQLIAIEEEQERSV